MTQSELPRLGAWLAELKQVAEESEGPEDRRLIKEKKRPVVSTGPSALLLASSMQHALVVGLFVRPVGPPGVEIEDVPRWRCEVLEPGQSKLRRGAEYTFRIDYLSEM